MMEAQMYDNQPPMMPVMPAQIQPVPSMSGMSDTIASMRWENDPLIINLRIRLGGYVPVADENGRTRLERSQDAHRLVNDLGIDRFIATIHGVVNPITSLSNIDDEESNTLIRQTLYNVLFDMVYNQHRFEIHTGDMRTVFSIMKSLVFFQFKRSVSGHEARNFRTQTIEQNMNSQMSTANQQRSNGLNPFSWGSRK